MLQMIRCMSEWSWTWTECGAAAKIIVQLLISERLKLSLKICTFTHLIDKQIRRHQRRAKFARLRGKAFLLIFRLPGGLHTSKGMQVLAETIGEACLEAISTTSRTTASMCMNQSLIQMTCLTHLELIQRACNPCTSSACNLCLQSWFQWPE